MRAVVLFFFCSLVSGCTPRVQGLEGIADKTYPVSFGSKSETIKNVSPITVVRAEQIGDFLALDVSYSGGCETHLFELIALGSHLPIYPPELLVKLKHNANGDRCRSFVQDRIYFDLNPFRLTGTNRINLIMEDHNITQTYDY